MLKVQPTGETLGATVTGIDLAEPLSEEHRREILVALGQHGVLCFPKQNPEPAALKAFSARFGTLEVNVAGKYQEPGLPEVMILSNIVENGQPIGLADAGQDWHTDMSYSSTIAFLNILHAIKVPRRDGRVLGSTHFCNMHAAYEGLPDELKTKLEGRTATHDFDKFWEMMRQRGGNRAPLTPEQRRAKPPVSHPIFLTHPITGTKVLYANPGYAVKIDGMDPAESDEILDFLFRHQTKPEYQYSHDWTEGDVLVWDDIGTIHNAIPDYRPDEPRLIKRCQVAADRIFEEGPALAA